MCSSMLKLVGSILYSTTCTVGSAGTAVRRICHRRVGTTVQYVVGVQVTRDEPHDGVMCLVERNDHKPKLLVSIMQCSLSMEQLPPPACFWWV